MSYIVPRMAAIAREHIRDNIQTMRAHLAQAAEWFPLLGLIGTVAAILQTFSSITPGSQPTPQDIIKKYAPAITATGSGVQRIRLVAGGQRLEVNDAGEALVATSLDGMVTRVPDPVRSDADLLAEELSILGPDPIYDQTLRAFARPS